MRIVKRYSGKTKRYHSPSATQALISLALLRIKDVTTRDTTDLHAKIRLLRVYEHLPSAIHYWAEYPNRILYLNVVYTKPPKQNTDNKSTGGEDEDTEMPAASEVDAPGSPILALKRFFEPEWAPIAQDLRILTEKSLLDVVEDMKYYVRENDLLKHTGVRLRQR